MKKKSLPGFLESVLWSYNINKMDIKKDKNLIIQQVLNYGDWEAVCWLFNTYKKKDIIQVIENPLRGRWFEQVLNYWSLIFNLRIPKEKYKKAVLNVNLEP